MILSKKDQILMRMIVRAAYKICLIDKDADILTEQELIDEYRSMGNECWEIGNEVKDHQGMLDDYKPTHFKLNKDVNLDYYSFYAGEWNELGGDFLIPGNDTPEGLERVLECELGDDFKSLEIEYKEL